MIEKNSRFSDKKRGDRRSGNKNREIKSSTFKSVSTNIKGSNKTSGSNNKNSGFNNNKKIETPQTVKIITVKREEKSAQRNSRLKPIYKINSLSSVTCSICGKVINNMSSSISDNNRDECYHFECVTNLLRKKLDIKPNQRLTYLGSLNFGVIEDNKDVNAKVKFSIKQKVQFVRD